jgi:flagellar motor component MotA
MNEKDFMSEYNAVFERSLVFSIISRSLGLVSLQNIMDKKKCNQRDIFEYGLMLVLDGRVPEMIDKILTNIINLETDKEKKVLKNIQKDAVLSIQQGFPSEQIMWIMNSYVNIDLDEATRKYNEINEYISKEMTNEFNKIQEKQNDTYKQVSEKIFDTYNKMRTDKP